jgi:hypothetical protein
MSLILAPDGGADGKGIEPGDAFFTNSFLFSLLLPQAELTI